MESASFKYRYLPGFTHQMVFLVGDRLAGVGTVQKRKTQGDGKNADTNQNNAPTEKPIA